MRITIATETMDGTFREHITIKEMRRVIDGNDWHRVTFAVRKYLRLCLHENAWRIARIMDESGIKIGEVYNS